MASWGCGKHLKVRRCCASMREVALCIHEGGGPGRGWGVGGGGLMGLWRTRQHLRGSAVLGQ